MIVDGDLFSIAGIELVLAAEPAAWKGHYAILCHQWFGGLPVGAVFNGEMLRLHALQRGLGEPHHPNVWGAMAAQVLGALHEDKRITQVGVRKALSAKSHAHFYRTYQKLS